MKTKKEWLQYVVKLAGLERVTVLGGALKNTKNIFLMFLSFPPCSA